MSKTIDEILDKIVCQESDREGGYAEYTLDDESIAWGDPLQNKDELKQAIAEVIERIIGIDEIELSPDGSRLLQGKVSRNALRAKQRNRLKKVLGEKES